MVNMNLGQTTYQFMDKQIEALNQIEQHKQKLRAATSQGHSLNHQEYPEPLNSSQSEIDPSIVQDEDRECNGFTMFKKKKTCPVPAVTEQVVRSKYIQMKNRLKSRENLKRKVGAISCQP